MPAMIMQKLRRASQQLPGRRKSLTGSHATTQDEDKTMPSKASFLGLPAEIRNAIYEQLALDTRLSLTPPRSRKRCPDPVGLLLACRQTYNEYRAMLLSSASLSVFVSDYNFGNVIRVLEKLSETDVDLLLANQNLWVVLRLAHVPSREDKKSIRAWHDYRSGNVQPYFKSGSKNASKLVFKYHAEFLSNMRPPRPANRYADGYAMRWDLLRSHIRMCKSLSPDSASQAGEIHHMRQDLEALADVLAHLHSDGPDDSALTVPRSSSVASQLSVLQTK